MTGPEQDASLELRLFGPPQIELNGAPVQVDTRKAVALLAYLAIERRAHSRDSLAALLWPEYEPSRAYANLRRTLWALNKALGKGWLDVEGESISLPPHPGLWVDVDAFRRHLETCASHGHGETGLCDDCRDPLTEAVGLARGDLLAGFSLRDSPPFDEWQFFQTEGLRQDLARALEKLGRCHTARGEFQAAIDTARRWLALDPLHEPAHQRLMELYAWTGQRAAALRQYAECVRLLEEELGLPPSEETQRLHQQVKAGRLPSATPPEPARQVLEVPDADTPGLAPPGPDAPRLAPQEPEALAPRSNLPVQLTPFVGRTSELAELLDLLQNPQCRLLTLVGPGGIGKTRLALQAARANLEPPGDPMFSHGHFFVSLAPVESPLHLASAIAAALDFTFYEREGEEPEQQLLNYLRNKQMLLLLDNFEHLLAGADLVAEVLSAAPGLKVLTTSRERLNLRGEWLFEVHGMSFPDDGTVGSLDRYSAVQLFLQRARMVDAGYAPAGQELADVIHICRLLDGMPLGIELAAAWIRILPAAEIGHEIQRSLDFLATSERQVPDRHRSLRAVCDHSWQLLSPPERSAFHRLSVFWGGFDRQAAEEVAGAGLHTLTALLDKSLVRQGPGGRYSLHEVLRTYAAEKLAATPAEEMDARDGHSRYYTDFLHQREDDLKGQRQIEALDEIAAETENVRGAWNWAAERCMAPALRQSAESMYNFSLIRQGFVEGEQAFARAAQALASPACRTACTEAGTDTERELALGLVLAFQAVLGVFWYSGDRAVALVQRSLDVLRPLGSSKELAVAKYLAGHPHLVSVTDERLVREALDHFRQIGDQAWVARCLHTLAIDSRSSGEAKVELLHESLAISRQLGARWGTASSLFALAELAHVEGDFAEARRNFQQSLAILQAVGDRRGIADASDHIGYVLREMGQYDEARRLHLEGLAISEEIGDQLGIAGSLDNLGLVARDEGDYEEARALFEEGLTIRRGVSRGWEIAVSLEHLGTVSLALGKIDLAGEQFQESLELSRQQSWSYGIAMALIGLSDVFSARGETTGARRHVTSALMLGNLVGNEVVFQQVLLCAARCLVDAGQREPAAEVLAFVLNHRATCHYTRTRAGRLWDELTAQLPPEALTAAQSQAASLNLTQITETAQAHLRD